jgi:hypothetical protein
MLEKLILAVILTFSIYLRYHPIIAHQHLTQIQLNDPPLKTAFVIRRDR